MEDKLYQKAKSILKNNIFNGKDGGYTAASGKMHVDWDNSYRFLYPFQWLWDTFFISAWSSDVEQSIVDINKFLNSQLNNGFLGHIRYNREILKNKDYFPPPDIYYYNDGGLPNDGDVISRITQPPNVSYGVWQLSRKIKDMNRRKEFLLNNFSKLFKYHQYIANKLCVDGLMVVIHPWQAGDDNSPRWDEIYDNIRKNPELHNSLANWLQTMGLKYERVDLKLVHHTQRPIDSHYDIYLYLIWLYGQWHWDEKKILTESPFRVLDPLTNSIWIRSCEALRNIALELDAKDEYIELKKMSDTATNSLEKLWSPEKNMYLTKDLSTSLLVDVETISGIVPLFSHRIPEDRANKIGMYIKRSIETENLNYFMPSTSSTEKKKFETIRYWRGPVWIIVNELLIDGLLFYGYNDLAKKIKEDSLKLVNMSFEIDSENSFFEYYDPNTGRGLGSPNQSWTAAAIIKLIETRI